MILKATNKSSLLYCVYYTCEIPDATNSASINNNKLVAYVKTWFYTRVFSFSDNWLDSFIGG